jgi:hypothetical protein
VTLLPHHFHEVPKDRPVYVFCASGLRSTIAASLLEREGRDDVKVVLGGFTGWNSSGLPSAKIDCDLSNVWRVGKYLLMSVRVVAGRRVR